MRWFDLVRGLIPAAGTLLAVSCSNNNSGGSSGGVSSCASPGQAAPGPADSHCGSTVQVVDPAACSGTVGDDGGGGGDDGGAAGDDGGSSGDDSGYPCAPPAGFGDTMFGTSGDDDDCKYHVSWTSDPICENQNVYFTVTATNKSDGSPVTGANPQADVTLDCTHTIPNHPDENSPEISPGTYKVGPVVFDQAGRWVFRFHFFETCNDLPQSPHGHAAFYVEVP